MSNNDKKLEELYNFMGEMIKKLEKLIIEDEPEESIEPVKGIYCTMYHHVNFIGEKHVSISWHVVLHEETAPPGAELSRGFYTEKSRAKLVMDEIDKAMTYIMGNQPTQPNQKS